MTYPWKIWHVSYENNGVLKCLVPFRTNEHEHFTSFLVFFFFKWSIYKLPWGFNPKTLWFCTIWGCLHSRQPPTWDLSSGDAAGTYKRGWTVGRLTWNLKLRCQLSFLFGLWICLRFIRQSTNFLYRFTLENWFETSVPMWWDRNTFARYWHE